MIHPIKGKSHLVVKRDGRIEPFSDKKLLRVVTWATDGSMAYAKTLLEAVDIKLYDKVRSEDLFDEVISTAANLISDVVPTWEKVAKNLYELKLHKEMGVLRSDYPDYEELVQKNVAHGIYDAAVIQQVDIPKLKEAINPAYDSLFTFGGLNVFVSKYCAKVKGKLAELPQHTYMRIAIQLMYKDGTEAIIAKYNQLANHEVTEATPKMVNSLRPSAALFSCCLVRPSDSLEGINEAINMLAKESKFSGGCAFDSSLLRSAGSVVAGNLGRSSGSIPYIQALQWVIAGYNQGSVRSSACIDTFSAYHYESPKIAQLKRESGKDEDRARRLQYSVKWNSHLSDAVLNNEDIYLFNPHRTQDLFESYGQQWRTLYQKYSRSHVTKQKYNARELAYIFATTAFDTGNLYFFFDDNANEQDIGAGYIPASNLCVTGDTRILTRDGYKPIETLAGTTQECWNGERWSQTPIFKTSDAEPILTVEMSNGLSIRATSYHKWYIAQQDIHGGLRGYKEVRTEELQPGDKLIKFNLEPVTHGTNVLPNAYENGFYSADGTSLHSRGQRIYLYDEKKKLLPYFEDYNSSSESGNRINLEYTCLADKFFIPDTSYRVQDRLAWLAGYLDGDGTLTDNIGAESIQISSINPEFLSGVLLLLQELGVQGKILEGVPAGYRQLPANDGTGDYKEYWCKASKRLVIAGSELQRLLSIGFKAYRVQPTTRAYNRSALQFTKIISITDLGEVTPVYCGTEPLRNKLMFNGVLTGNCQEMVMSYEPIKMVTTKLQDNSSVVEFTGDMALCNLASINLAKWIKFTPEEKEQKMYLLVKSTDNAIENSYYVNPLGKKHSLLHRNIGIGTSNYANVLASNKLLWNSEEARKYTHELYEELSYYAIKASVELAKETARCPIFSETKWAKGVFPHELSKLSREKPELTYPLLMNWEPLRKDLLKYGIRNSRLLAIAPTSTSGKTINATEGVDPPRKLKSIQEGTYSLPFVVPDLALYRDYYQTTFEISNKDVIELASIRQRFLCMSQSVSLAYTSSKSAHELIENVIYAEKLGLKTLYYTHTRKANEDGEHRENCESCSS